MDRTTTVQFYVSDDITLGSDIVVTATSANTNLLPEAGLVLEYLPDITWNLALTPSTGQTGMTTLTLTATDDTGLTATTNLTVTVFQAPLVTFADTNLEAAVRNALGIPTDPLTTYDLQSLTYSMLPGPTSPTSPAWQWATNLTYLSVSGNGPDRSQPAACPAAAPDSRPRLQQPPRPVPALRAD